MADPSLERPTHRRSPRVQCLRIAKSYVRGKEVLREADLDIYPGDFVLLTGPSGSGKTTFFKLVLDLAPLSGGHILIEGRNLHSLHRGEIPCFRRRTGLVPQELKILPGRSALENVAIPLEVAGVDRLTILERGYRALRLVGYSCGADQPCREAPGTERYKVALARAMVNDPALLLVDEPAAALDPDSLRAVMVLLERARMGGAAVVVASRDGDLASMVRGARKVSITQKRFIEAASDERVGPVPGGVPDIRKRGAL